MLLLGALAVVHVHGMHTCPWSETSCHVCVHQGGWPLQLQESHGSTVVLVGPSVVGVSNGMHGARTIHGGDAPQEKETANAAHHDDLENTHVRALEVLERKQRSDPHHWYNC